MRVIRIVKIAVSVAAILFLAGCILEPQDENGSIAFSVSAPEASISGSSITVGDETFDDPDGDDFTHARVWMYSNGAEYRLVPTSAGASSSRNYVETELGSRGATVTIDGIPAGNGYSAVVILGTKEGDVFVPLAYAQTDRFAINAGLQTQLTPQKVVLVDPDDDDSQLSSADFNLIGTDLNSVVVSNGVVIAADRTTVYEGLTEPSERSGFGTINRLSTGTLEGASVVFVNSSEGIFKAGETPEEITPSDDTELNVENVTFSGTFQVDNSTEEVVFYQRDGGLGGVADTSVSSDSSWEDFGAADLEDLIDPETSPVRAQASGSGKGFFATPALDNFRITEKLFDSGSDIEAADLISGTAAGVQFFNVPYPGTSRPMRIDHMEVVNVGDEEYLVVGTPRGAFTFPQSSIGGDSEVFNSSTNVVNGSHGSFRSLIRDEPVVALTTDPDGKWLAVASAETIFVLRMDNGIPDSRDQALSLPRRAVALGEVTGLALELEADGSVTLHVSGTQGLTTVRN